MIIKYKMKQSLHLFKHLVFEIIFKKIVVISFKCFTKYMNKKNVILPVIFKRTTLSNLQTIYLI